MERGRTLFLQRAAIALALSTLLLGIALWTVHADNGITPGPITGPAWTRTINNPDVSSVQEVQTCENTTTTHDVPTYGTCVYHSTFLTCPDNSNNATCFNDTKDYPYQCQNGTTTVQDVRVDCTTTSLLINNVTISDLATYQCSAVEDGKIYITCDSKYDGNGDGKCTSGESCVRYDILGTYVHQTERNSQDTFVDTDQSFTLGTPTAVSS